jgi:hypothetical protein
MLFKYLRNNIKSLFKNTLEKTKKLKRFFISFSKDFYNNAVNKILNPLQNAMFIWSFIFIICRYGFNYVQKAEKLGFTSLWIYFIIAVIYFFCLWYGMTWLTKRFLFYSENFRQKRKINKINKISLTTNKIKIWILCTYFRIGNFFTALYSIPKINFWDIGINFIIRLILFICVQVFPNFLLLEMLLMIIQMLIIIFIGRAMFFYMLGLEIVAFQTDSLFVKELKNQNIIPSLAIENYSLFTSEMVNQIGSLASMRYAIGIGIGVSLIFLVVLPSIYDFKGALREYRSGAFAILYEKRDMYYTLIEEIRDATSAAQNTLASLEKITVDDIKRYHAGQKILQENLSAKWAAIQHTINDKINQFKAHRSAVTWAFDYLPSIFGKNLLEYIEKNDDSVLYRISEQNILKPLPKDIIDKHTAYVTSQTSRLRQIFDLELPYKKINPRTDEFKAIKIEQDNNNISINTDMESLKYYANPDEDLALIPKETLLERQKFWVQSAKTRTADYVNFQKDQKFLVELLQCATYSPEAARISNRASEDFLRNLQDRVYIQYSMTLEDIAKRTYMKTLNDFNDYEKIIADYALEREFNKKVRLTPYRIEYILFIEEFKLLKATYEQALTLTDNFKSSLTMLNEEIEKLTLDQIRYNGGIPLNNDFLAKCEKYRNGHLFYPPLEALQESVTYLFPTRNADEMYTWFMLYEDMSKLNLEEIVPAYKTSSLLNVEKNISAMEELSVEKEGVFLDLTKYNLPFFHFFQNQKYAEFIKERAEKTYENHDIILNIYHFEIKYNFKDVINELNAKDHTARLKHVPDNAKIYHFEIKYNFKDVINELNAKDHTARLKHVPDNAKIYHFEIKYNFKDVINELNAKDHTARLKHVPDNAKNYRDDFDKDNYYDPDKPNTPIEKSIIQEDSNRLVPPVDKKFRDNFDPNSDNFDPNNYYYVNTHDDNTPSGKFIIQEKFPRFLLPYKEELEKKLEKSSSTPKVKFNRLLRASSNLNYGDDK